MRHATQKILVGLASLTLVDIAVAVAADLPVKAPPKPTYNWSGFYVGAHAGYRSGDANFSGPGYIFDPGIGPVAFPGRSETYRPNGAIAGVQGGYNFMITPKILAGIEGDWTWGSGRAGAIGGFSINANDSFSFVSQTRLAWQSTIRGRLGVVNGPWLFYGTGGVAFTRVNWSDTSTWTVFGTPTAFSSSNVGSTLTGAAVGVGFEYMCNPNWIARLEYLYESFGKVSVPFGLGPQTGTLDLRDVNKVRAGISYKFNQ
ncbi:MAG: porin family protein [Bradyrhizobium sp.]|uniref:outer membrane protein n=1 Tax=Bradyrhizobium sp. TaxID=376 RepID=UPI0012000813|nr:outer membrane beta-barrel protein [Bradyrhizobium sp.]THD66869.1 MAG: porin family protein [Bradyrhizobium sp.]